MTRSNGFGFGLRLTQQFGLIQWAELTYWASIFSPPLKLLMGEREHRELGDQLLEPWSRLTFSEEICKLIGGRYIRDLYGAISNMLTNEVTTDFTVFCSFMENFIEG